MGLTEKYRGEYVTAKSAADYIDAKGIMESANKIKKELEDFSAFSAAVTTAGSQLNVNTLSVDGLDCSEMVDYVSQVISNSYTAMLGHLDEVIAAAEKAYNEKQDEYNQDARYRDQQEKEKRAAAAASASNA